MAVSCIEFLLLAVVVALFSVLVFGVLARVHSAQERNCNSGSPSRSGGRTGTTIYYRTKDGTGDYGFALERRGIRNIRVYIVSYPSEQAERTAPHRLSDGGRNYICWSEPIRSEEAALVVAAQWADNVQQFLKTGQGF